MKRQVRLRVAIACAMFICLGSAASVYGQSAMTKIRISYPSASICCLALFAAQQWKVFEENGLDVEAIQMRSQAANTALVSGDIHYVAGVGPNSVAATLRGLPSRAIWFASDRLIYSLIARPAFKSLRELRSKKIGITGLGGTSEVALRIALEAVGENPRDFVIMGLGAPQLMTGLETGSIDAAQLDPPFSILAKKKGYRDLLDLGAHVQMPLGGLTASMSSIQNRSGELRRVVRSLQTAKRMILQSKEKSVDLLMGTLKIDRMTAEDTYTEYRKTVSGNGIPTRDGIEQIVKSLQLLGQFPGKKVAFEEVADARIATDVARELGYKIE